MGLVDAAGEVVEQYVYGPYGELVPVHADNPADPLARMGHQGLFFVRLDGWADDPAMVPGAVGLCYNRNRWYSPYLGRFIQRDVNETALPILTALAFNAESLDSLLSAFDAQGLYGDGMNLYEYVSSNSINRRDPAGLWWLPELAVTAGESSYLRSQEGAYVTGMAALVFAMLGNAYTNMTWGVTGGMSAESFDTFLDATSAVMTGEYVLAETLYAVASATTVFAISRGEAIKRARALWPPIKEHFAKIAKGGPNDPRNNPVAAEIRAWLGKVKDLTKNMKGKTAESWLKWVERAERALEQVSKGGGNNLPPMPT